MIFFKVENKWEEMYIRNSKTPQIRSKALCMAEGDNIYFPEFEKKNQ